MVTTILATLIAMSLNALAEPQAGTGRAAKDQITVYRASTCGCCGKWAEHLKQAGFAVTVNIVDRVDSVEARHRVPQRLRSCHVAFVGPYAVEGHVPADVIKSLLAKRPAGIEGIAVPGMPLGSPGMESPTPEPYDIIAFDKTGRTSIFAKR